MPRVHDEFSHLLLADTLRNGRLANPTHLFWHHFETQYVIFQPTYSSIYPLGLATLLAMGRFLTGHPWMGVLLATGLFCGMTYWMLHGWLPRGWATVGGFLTAFQFGVGHLWMEIYYSGVLAALGGAILFGALPRLWQSRSVSHSLLLIGGWGIVWFTRPFEAGVLALILIPIMLTWLARQVRSVYLPVLIPTFSAAALIGGVTMLHNYRVTGDPFTLPYRQYQRIYGAPQNLAWQQMVTGPIPERRTLRDNFEWQKLTYERKFSRELFLNHAYRDLNALRVFYAGYVGRGLPLLLLFWPPLWRRDHRVPLLLGILSTAFLASLLYPLRQPHYLAHYTCLCVLALMLALREMWIWQWKHRPAGAALVTLLLATTWVQ